MSDGEDELEQPSTEMRQSQMGTLRTSKVQLDHLGQVIKTGGRQRSDMHAPTQWFMMAWGLSNW